MTTVLELQRAIHEAADRGERCVHLDGPLVVNGYSRLDTRGLIVCVGESGWCRERCREAIVRVRVMPRA